MYDSLATFLAYYVLFISTSAVSSEVLLVKYKNAQGRNSAVNRASRVVHAFDEYGIIAVEVSDEKTALSAFQDDQNIASTDRSGEMSLIEPIVEAAPEDIQQRRLVESIPWGITRVQAPTVAAGPNAGDIKVCIVDTGYGLDHPDLPGEPTVTGNDNSQYPGQTWHVDGVGHGTHCAGTIAAIGSNDQGVVGVIPDANSSSTTLHIGKGLTNAGSGSSLGVMIAVQQCVDAGAKVVSMSLGGSGSPTEENYFSQIYARGVLVIAAAGNGGSPQYGFPASYPSIMSVAAVDAVDNVAYFSQHNSAVELSGPGVSVFSTVTTNSGANFGYATYSGTSMATPVCIDELHSEP